MNDQDRREIESGQRCRQWFVDYKAIVPSGSIFDSKGDALTGLVNDIDGIAGDIQTHASEGVSATTVKGNERTDLLAEMEPVRDAARGAEEDHPGTRDRYRYYVAMSDEALLAAGRSFAAGGATDQTLLENYGAPAGWPALVTAACDAFEASFGQQDSAVGSRVASNATLKAKLKDLTKLKGSLRHIVKNYTINNPGARAAWNTAAHVERPPKKKKPMP